MKTYYRFSSIILLLSLVTIGCKKKEIIIEYPVKLYAERIEVRTNIRMFTNAGEVKDQAQIAEFVKDQTIFEMEKEPIQEDLLGITFFSEEEMLVGETQRKYALIQNGRQFLFYSADPVTGYDDGTKGYLKELLKHKYPNTPVFQYYYTTKEVVVAHGNLRELKFARLAYYAYKSVPGQTSWSSGGANNEFNEAVVTLMKPGEKLAVKEYYMVFKAR